MKHSKLSLFIMSLVCLCFSAAGQDMSINILQQPAIMNTNSTNGKVTITIQNNPNTFLSLPAYKLYIHVSVPDFVTITGISDLPANWKICRNDGQDIFISNGTGTIPPLGAEIFHLDIASGATTHLPTTITATITDFDTGIESTSCNGLGAPTTGDQVANNNSTTSVGVENSAGPMPIKQIDLSALLNSNEKVDVKWITTDELNVDHFEVERSTDGVSFSKVATKKAIGNTTGKTIYDIIDDVNSVTASTVYYRVKVTDIDRSSYYSKIVPVSLGKDAAIKVWPNPFMDRVNIKIDPRTKGKAVVKLFSNNGMLIKQKEILVFPGTNFVTLDGLGKLPKEIYAIDVRIDNEKVYSGMLVK